MYYSVYDLVTLNPADYDSVDFNHLFEYYNLCI